MERLWLSSRHAPSLRSLNTKRNRAVLLAIVLIAGMGVFSLYQANPGKPAASAPPVITAGVTVNGETISMQEIEEAYGKLPDNAKEELTKNQVAEGLVGQALLLQEAERKGIETTDEEIEEYLRQSLVLSGLDQASLLQKLADQGLTLNEYRQSLKEMFSVSKLLSQELGLQDVTVTDQDVEASLQREEFQDILAEGDPELEDMLRTSLKRTLTQEKHQQLIEGYVQSLKERARIEYL